MSTNTRAEGSDLCVHNVEHLGCYKCNPKDHTYLGTFAVVIEGALAFKMLGTEEFAAKDAHAAFHRASQMAKAKRYYGPVCNYYRVYKLLGHRSME